MDPPPATEVGDAFVEQYYYVLNHWPDEIYLAYNHHSKIGRPGPDGKPRFASFYDIDKKTDLNMLSSGGFDSARVTSTDSRYLINGHLEVEVVGYFTLNRRVDRNFVHVFYLAPRERGFFVVHESFAFDDVSISLAVDEDMEESTICLKKLPSNATNELLKKAFKKFGAITKDDIAIVKTISGNYYAFLVFKDRHSANVATQASPVKIGGGHRVQVEKMRGGGFLENIKIIEKEIREQDPNREEEATDFLEWMNVIKEKGTKDFNFWSGQERSKPKEEEKKLDEQVKEDKEDEEYDADEEYDENDEEEEEYERGEVHYEEHEKYDADEEYDTEDDDDEEVEEFK